MISPKLFTNFLTDISQYLDVGCGAKIGETQTSYLLYADDLVLISTSATGLQRQLTKLWEYCRRWHLIVNMAKTKILIFNCKNNAHSFIYNDEKVEVATTYRYLGLDISSSKRDIFHLVPHQLAEKGRKALYQAYSNCHTHIGKPGARLAFKIFDTQVRPILDYGAEIWGAKTFRASNELEVFHLKFIKTWLGVRKQTASAAVYAETGSFPLEAKRKVQILKYWIRLLSLPQGHILQQCYQTLLALPSAKSNWVTYVKELLSSLGNIHSQLWVQQTDNLAKLPVPLIETIYTQYSNRFLSVINNGESSNKLRTYKLLKKHCSLEYYLLYVQNPLHRSALAQLRLSSHNLGIETGRHCRPSKLPENRICAFCPSGQVDDEIHFLIHCKAHDDLRTTILPDLKPPLPDAVDRPDSIVFTEIMCSTDPVILKQLGKFIFLAFKDRRLPS